MVKVRIYRSTNGAIKGFEVTGHAGYAKHGRDIVCSAVSILTQTTVIGVVKVAGINAEYKLEDGYILCKLPEIEPETAEAVKSSAIIETMYEGLINIKKSYKNYIDIVEEEV